MKKDKRCKICGEPIPEDSAPQRKYCSRSCLRVAEKERAKKVRAASKAYCINCGKMIPPGSSKHKYCSDECLKDAYRKTKKCTRGISVEKCEEWNPKVELYAEYQARTYVHPDTGKTIEDSVRIRRV